MKYHVQFEDVTFLRDDDVEVPVTVSATVDVENDIYATGDSPKGYDVNLLSVVDEDGNNIVKKIDGFCTLVLEEVAARQINPEVTFY